MGLVEYIVSVLDSGVDEDDEESVSGRVVDLDEKVLELITGFFEVEEGDVEHWVKEYEKDNIATTEYVYFWQDDDDGVEFELLVETNEYKDGYSVSLFRGGIEQVDVSNVSGLRVVDVLRREFR